MEFKTNQKLLTSIGAISLTDIVFLLLIFFLLSASFVIQPGIKVKLPESATKQETSDKPITIVLTRTNDIYLNEKPVILEELPGRLNALLEKDSDQTVVIKSDQEVSLQEAVSVMDAAKAGGATKFMIATSPGE
jgi:biopolymer transport protein ExbD